MVVPTEVKNSMDQQRDDFLIERTTPFSRLTNGCRNGNHHIAQHPAGEVRRMRGMGFPHGERQDVCGAILLAKAPIETPHPPIADERETQFCRGFSDFGEHGLHKPQ